MTPDHADKLSSSFPARVLGVASGEFAAVAWSFVYFFCLLSTYYMLRSVREAMAIVSGVGSIPWLFTGTFTVMLLVTPIFGWIASRYPRRTFLPWVHYFFIANILMFFAAFTAFQRLELDSVWVARTFFVWLSVFNLFVVSVFWSFMADIYTKEQSRRLFGLISAGGSSGALAGPILTGALVVNIGFQNLLLLAAVLLSMAVFCIYRLRRWSLARVAESPDQKPSGEPYDAPRLIGGSAFAGIKLVLTTPYLLAIAASLMCANFLGVVLYMYMAELVSVTFPDTDRQTQVFALLDGLTNALAFLGQLLLVKYAVRTFGVGITLAVLPLVSVLGFMLLALNPVFIVVAGLQLVRRSITFGLTKPTTDMLYSVVSREAKYKAKNFTETVIYRGGDLVSAWTIKLLSGLGLGALALICVPLAVVWTLLALWVGYDYRRRDRLNLNPDLVEEAAYARR